MNRNVPECDAFRTLSQRIGFATFYGFVQAMICGMPLVAAAADKIAPVVPPHASPFDLREVKLLDGPFKHAMDVDQKYLLSLDPDRLLLVFRLNAGIPSDAKPYGGWMAPNAMSRGEFVGHYLSACARMYVDTDDETLKKNANRVVAGLAECQTKFGNGYLHTHADTFSERGEAPVPFFYQMHKTVAGLLDMHEYCGNAQALEIAQKLGDWCFNAAAKLSDEQIQRILDNEHGGINEAWANLYARTGDEKYLKLSRRFNHAAVLGPAMNHVDALDNLHANTQIPKFIGLARQHELTGDDSFHAGAEFFWNNVVHERSYVIGGHSDCEKFSPKAALSHALSPNTCETCNTYNMIKLTRQLFRWDPKSEYGDYCERAIFNHILGSQNPETGMMGYYMPLNNSPKLFSEPENSFWCCCGTGVENHARYGECIYFHDGAKCLYVNLFIASELQWKERSLTLRQETQFPESATSKLTVTCREPVELTIKLRRPCWAVSGFEISVNGEKQNTESQPSSYISLKRRWQSGDTIDIRMPMNIHTEGFCDNPKRLAILYGPIALSMPCDGKTPSPVIVGEIDKISAAIHPTEQPLHFQCSPDIFRAVAKESKGPIVLSPFYQQYRQPYVTYWDVVTEEAWKAKCEAYEAEKKRQESLNARTIDQVATGVESSESSHHYQGEQCHSGPGMDGRMWRDASNGGWFSYEMNTAKKSPLELICTYWGDDAGGRDFDILVDGVKIATESLKGGKPNGYIDRTYSIPVEVTAGKERVTIRFQAQPGKTAGGVFGCRLLLSSGSQ
jgi:DUF1680 family protein